MTFNPNDLAGEVVHVGSADEVEAGGSRIEAWAPHHGMPISTAGELVIVLPEWLDDALCTLYDDTDAWQIDPSAWDTPEGGKRARQVGPSLTVGDLERLDHARNVCASCAVRGECLALAQEYETIPSGIFAGLDWEQRGGERYTAEADSMAARRARLTDEEREEIRRKDRERKRAKR